MSFRILIRTSLAFSLLIPQITLADCNWSEDVKKSPDGYHYDYSKECHKKVGDSLEELDLRIEQVQAQSLAIRNLQTTAEEFYNETLVYRAGMEKLEKRTNALESLEKRNKLLYFLLGVGVTGLAVYGAGQLK